MSFKLKQYVECLRSKAEYGIRGDWTVQKWLRKQGTFDWENQTPSDVAKKQEQEILELKQK
jgi:hypothetical protein